MDLLADLTPAQCEAVTHVDGPLLVLAGAGSGKTRVITRRVAYLLDQGIDGRNILALTFTNKAAGEMRERIHAIAPKSGTWVGTFHGLCARLLRQYGHHAGLDRGFTIYDQGDRGRLIKSALERLGLDGAGVSPDRVESAISRAKNDLVSPETYATRGGGDHIAAIVAKVYPIYQKALLDASAVDFDDLLTHLVAILRRRPEVRARLDSEYRYILVDEYQDTNLAQYAILRALSTDWPNLCATGDPDQSIYGWRGANLDNILDFEKDFKGAKVVKLERNYRSTKNILRVADHLIRFNRRRKPKSLTTENATGAPVRLTTFATETDEARAVAGEILELVRDGGYSYSDMAIFCRVTALTRHLETALRACGIPYQIVGGVAFYERQEIKDVLSYINLMLNPKDDLAFLRVVNTPPRGLGKTTLDRLADRARELQVPLLTLARQGAAVPGLKDRSVAALRDFAMLMDELMNLRDRCSEEVIRKLLSLTGYHDYLESNEGEERLANVDELVSAARQFDAEHPGSSILDFLEHVSLSSAVDRWDDHRGAVALMTLHAAKGLEFPVAFVVGLEQGLLPHSRAGEDESELEEERRLLFVGITRARRELYLSHCRIREFRGQRTATVPSCFLAELPEDALEVSDRSGYLAPSPHTHRPRIAATPQRVSEFRLTTAAALGKGQTTETPPPISPDRFRPGITVVHPSYGLGRLVAIDGAGPNRKARVAFAVGGERTFILAKSPLRPLQGG